MTPKPCPQCGTIHPSLMACAVPDPVAELNQRLIDRTDAFMKQTASLLSALRTVDRFMKGNTTYEAAWINYPDKPEQTVADVVRAALRQLIPSTLNS